MDLESRSLSQNRLSILLLCDDNPSHADTILQHIKAFTDLSTHDVRVFNPRWLKGSCSLDLDEFDVVVIHYSLVLISNHYLASDFREKLRRFQGLKVQFIQDDYRWVDRITAMMRYIGVDVLFTLVPPAEIPKIWDEVRLPDVAKVTTLAGYVPDTLMKIQTPPLDSRPLDIGYRGRVLPYWIGKIGQEKVWIGQGVLERAQKYGLCCDIAWREEDRIYGGDWVKFICSCRATLGTESGATITDFDGTIERQVNYYLARHPHASFWEVYHEILEPYEGNVKMNVISPRMFEAIALRTALILFPGEYSGILQAWTHYIPLQKDFSNMDEVVEKLRDTDFLRAMTERAHTDIVASGKYSYQAFIRQFDQIVSQYPKPQAKQRKVRYRLAQIERVPYLLAYKLFYMGLGLLSHKFPGRRILVFFGRPVVRSCRLMAKYLNNILSNKLIM